MHPRYTVFTLLTALICLSLLFFTPPKQLFTFTTLKPQAPLKNTAAEISLQQTQKQQNTTTKPKTQRTKKLWSSLTTALSMLLLLPLLIFPHTSLSNERAASSSPGISNQTIDTVTAAEQSDFASLAKAVAAGTPARDFAGNTITLTGFVNANEEQNTLLLSRYSVTCCIVDAQPLVVPVYFVGTKPKPGAWITVSGFFIDNPDPVSHRQTLLNAVSITEIAEPRDPYLAEGNTNE